MRFANFKGAVVCWSTCSLIALVSSFNPVAYANGMLPETSVVIVHEENGEATINVTNTDPKPALLLVAIHDIPEDQQPLLLVTPQVSRVEPSASQSVRFILRTEGGPLTAQRLKRVTFEGVAQAETAQEDSARIGVGVRQNLPVIIHPKGLELEREPWKLLKWSHQQGTLTVHNDSPYVVRLAQQVDLLPMQSSATLPSTYVLPGERVAVTTSPTAAAVQGVRLYPATVYGYSVDAFDAPVN